MTKTADIPTIKVKYAATGRMHDVGKLDVRPT